MGSWPNSRVASRRRGSEVEASKSNSPAVIARAMLRQAQLLLAFALITIGFAANAWNFGDWQASVVETMGSQVLISSLAAGNIFETVTQVPIIVAIAMCWAYFNPHEPPLDTSEPLRAAQKVPLNLGLHWA